MWTEAFAETLKNDAVSKILILRCVSTSEVNIFPYNLIVFAFLQQYYLYEHHSTTNNILRVTFTSACNKHFLGHLKLFKNFLTTFWTTMNGWEMTARLIRRPVFEPVIVCWRNNVSVQCSSRDCQRFACLHNAIVFLSIFYDFPAFCPQ